MMLKFHESFLVLIVRIGPLPTGDEHIGWAHEIAGVVTAPLDRQISVMHRLVSFLIRPDTVHHLPRTRIVPQRVNNPELIRCRLSQWILSSDPNVNAIILEVIQYGC